MKKTLTFTIDHAGAVNGVQYWPDLSGEKIIAIARGNWRWGPWIQIMAENRAAKDRQ